MDKKALTFIGSAVLTTLISGASYAGKGSYFTDYARVLRAEPIYKYVTVQKPERRCEIVRSGHGNNRNNNRPHNRQHNGQRHRSHRNNGHRNNGHLNTQSARSRAVNHSNTNSAVFIGGVIGGAIGHHVTRNINGRGNVGATLAGAAIGSTLAHTAARNQISTQPHNQNRGHMGLSHNRGHNGRDNRILRRNHHRPDNYERCRTINVSYEERRHDGYNVTYRYHGHTFNTRTAQDPGDRIAVRVQIKPH